MKTTNNYGLKKPEGNEYISIDDMNYNFDKVDDELGKVNRQGAGRIVSLAAAAWSSTAPYTQTVSVPGVTAEDVPVIGISITEGTTAANVKLQNKAWSCVDRAVTGAGTITFYCYNKKPASDFKAIVKGVG